jgi:glycine/D-amino acid oxidase-like deaminating enzyme/nitrite reductase/ring-hydroxylating ferredoxin subunit
MNEKIDYNGLPKHSKPLWRTGLNIPSFSPYTEDAEFDVVIVGAGITGITTAYFLTQAGMKVAILEANKIFNGTTGHTTAKITAQHDVIYHELIQHFGLEKTKIYYQSTKNAMDFIKKYSNDNKLDCNYEIQDAIIYTNSDQDVNKLHQEMKAYEAIGIDSFADEKTLLPFDTKFAITMKQQAQFHPIKYLIHLLKESIENGLSVYENTVAINIETGKFPVVVTQSGKKIKCKHIVSASHFPFYDGKQLFFTKLYADRSYVLAAKIKSAFPGGMYLSAENPKRSLRTIKHNNEELVLIGGESHKTGAETRTMSFYENLKQFGEDIFGIEDIKYRWSTQDLITLDKVPYIGRLSSKNENIYVATGFRKWGMTNGTVSAKLISNLILEKEAVDEEVFSPSRFQADPSIKHFLMQNLDVAKHLIEGKLEPVSRKIEELYNDEGSVVTLDGKRVGAYKDVNGKVHCVDTTCTHLGCEVEWNNGEKSWDCPCHGSRFSIYGEVLEGPAEQPLKQVFTQ